MRKDLRARALLILCAAALCASVVAQTRRTTGSRTTATQPAAKKSAPATVASPLPTPSPAPSPTPAKLAEPYANASAQEMAGKCVQLETEAGVIEIETLPQSAPVTVRNFLNLVAVGAFDTTTFSRVVPGFVIQGGNLSTRQSVTPELAERSRRTITDEPNDIKHVRGVVSMARPETPNGATTNFFILVADAPYLDGKFAAFGRVRAGMDVVDAINHAPVEGEKPVTPVRLTRATIFQCAADKSQTTVPPLD
ncbi:MAG: peptidylprolyl isomerase [Acidobacteriota bacterium]|nr:peptidylprolyl isomerase [Acidobacteriota bacterium]